MADELDLETGGRQSPREERRRRREGAGGESKTTSEKLDRELHGRLTGALDQVVEWRQAREDEELATAIDEDKEKMAKGLVSLTHVVVPLRQPLLIFLGFVEPLLAFGRVGRILAGRWFERRAQRAEEMAQAQAEWDAQHAANAGQPGVVSVG